MNLKVAAGLLLLSTAPGSIAAPSLDVHALFAAERVATGGEAWNAVAAIHSTGKMVVGDVPSPVDQMVDHRSGFSRQKLDAGGVTDISGFNGKSWDATGGLVNTVDLPGMQADAVTQAYIARDGWWNPNDRATMSWLRTEALGADIADVVRVVPAGGSPVDVWISRSSHLITKTVQDTDVGPLATTYGDWRLINGVRLPFEQLQTAATGATVAIKLASVSTEASVDANAFVPPPRPEHGAIAGGSVATVPFRFDALTRGHIVVDGKVESKPVTLIFDTGGANYFTPEAAKRLGLKPAGGVTINGVGEGSLTGGFANVREIALGKARLTDQSAIVAPLPFVAVHPRSGLNNDGLVGAEFFWTFRTQIDYLGRTLRFSDPHTHTPVPAKGVSLPFFTDGHTAYVEATIDGATGLFGIDTGDPGGVTVFRRFADAHRIFQGKGAAKVTGGGVGGHTNEMSFPAHAFTFAGVVLPPPRVDVVSAKSGGFSSKTIAGNIGGAVLSRFVMTFDPLKHTLTLSPNSTVNAPYPRNHVGLSATQDEPSRLKVLSVDPKSAAEAAGLRPGDSIVAVNGRSVAQARLGLYDLSPLMYGSVPFSLTIERDGSSRTVRIVPNLAD